LSTSVVVPWLFTRTALDQDLSSCLVGPSAAHATISLALVDVDRRLLVLGILSLRRPRRGPRWVRRPDSFARVHHPIVWRESADACAIASSMHFWPRVAHLSTLHFISRSPAVTACTYKKCARVAEALPIRLDASLGFGPPLFHERRLRTFHWVSIMSTSFTSFSFVISASSSFTA